MARRKRRGPPNSTGRSNTSRFARLDFRLLNSPAYRGLSPNCRSLLIELAMLENGENNGSLYLSVRDAAARMGVADVTAAGRAFDELQQAGFIVMTCDAAFNVKAAQMSRARCWKITWQASGRKGPTWDFLSQEPAPGTPARKRMDRGLRALKAYRKARDQSKMPVLDSRTMDPFLVPDASEAVLDSSTAPTENCGFSGQVIVLDSATHTAVTMGNGETLAAAGWWTNDRMTRAAVWAASINAASSLEARAA